MMRKLLIGVLAMAVLAGVAMAQDESAFDSTYNAVLSQLQSMGHGYYSAKEWAQIDESVQGLMKDAAQRKDGDAIVKAAIIRAMVLSDMRRQHAAAVQTLAAARQQVATMKNVDASQLYVKEAEVQAEAGDAAAVAAVLDAYKASKYYNPKPYSWSGMAQPGDPLLMARPGATGGDSLPETIMEKALLRAKSAPGIVFPDAALTDIYGNTFMLSSLRGKVVLLDFFARGWKRWEDDLPIVTDLRSRYHASGFEVVSICLELNAEGLEALRLPWPVVAGAPALTRPLGIFGSTASYLLDQQGAVIARDLHGQDLVFAVRQALGK